MTTDLFHDFISQSCGTAQSSLMQLLLSFKTGHAGVDPAGALRALGAQPPAL